MISRHFSSATDQSGDIVVAPINYDGNDEIADVVLSFNKMAEDVERTTTSVDKLNKEITERKQADEALQASEGKLNAMLQAIADIIALIDNELNIIWANDVAKEIYGDDIVGKKCYEAYHRSDKPCEPHSCATVKAFQDGNIHQCETQVTDKDGKSRYLLCIANVAFRDKDGKPSAVLEICRDITERKRMEEALRGSEEKYKNLFEQMSSGVAVYEAIDNGNDFVIRDFNRAGENIEHLDREDIIGKRVTEVFPGINEFGLLDVFKRVWGTGKTEYFPDALYIDKNGRRGWRENWIYRLPTGEVVAVYNDITERKQTEESLRASDRKYSELVQQSPDAIISLDKTGNFLSFNSAAEHMSGFSAQEVLGRHFTKIDILDKKSIPKAIKEFGLVLTGAERQPFELTILHKDKSRVCLEANPRRVKHKGKKTWIEVTLRDITERKQAERALTSEKLLSEEYINSLPGLFYVFDDQRFVRWNKQWKRITGYSDEELAGMYGTDFFEGEDKTLIGERMLEVFNEGASEAEAELVTKNGRRIPFYFTGLRKKLNRKDHLIGLGIDITERKKAEQSLNKSENLLRTTINATKEAMISIGEDGLINLFNQAAEEMFGHKREEMIGESLDCLIPEQYRQQHRQYVKSYFTTGKPDAAIGNTLELPALRSDGSVFPVELSLSAGVVDDKQFVIAVARDITERKEAEQTLAKLNKDLESTNVELTRTNKELQEFAYITAHDLKTPLRGIGTLAQWISTDYADKFDEQGKEQVNMLVTAARRMSALIDNIMQYCRLGRENQEKQQVDLNTVLSDVITTISPPKNIEITVENELPTLRCEKTQIIHIFQHLLSNAVRYMDKPKGQIKIGCIEQDCFWKFCIADNGPGINQKYFEKIFKIFQTLSPGDQVENTGIGLSIVKKIVELNGGRIWVESKTGEGTTFFFTLPKSGVPHEVSMEATSENAR